ncbi:MAG TPA: ATP-binding protein [Pyrinomonadaceae bacterium]|jgi:signal transduction histidine kinase/ActR/RegA family two-component response regulator|nr:ATP-binding protein [Pyrinomonadaceae bacterium]
MTKPEQDTTDGRVLILAPTGRDAALTGKYLAEAGISVEPCAGIENLCLKISEGAGAVLISEEALTREAVECLTDELKRQPPWADLPLVVLTGGEETAPASLRTLNRLGDACNMTLVERPTRVITLLSAVRSALRARRRQYEVRALLEEETRSREERTRLLDEAVRAREQAEAANRAKDVFLATLSHELRTPLTAVLGWARMIRNLEMDDHTARHGLLVIERNAESQNQLIQDLLDVSRIVTGKLRLEVKPMELVPIVRAAIESVQQVAEAKAIRLDAAFETDSALVTGDAERLQQVVWNLLSNAIKFTPKEGHVEVKLEHHGSDVRIKVSDTGEGIAPEFLPHVFERFRQADGSTTRRHGGLGLGLAVVRHLIEQHGGSVSAESEGEGKGATFIVDLPIIAVRPRAAEGRDEEEDASGVSPQTGGSESLDGVRVLVVDDQSDARELLSMVLNYAGAEVSTAGSAEEALQLLKRVKPDVLVSDIGMPEQDGFALIGRVRSLSAEQGGQVRAIALTAYVTEEERQRSLDAGFERHINKPVEPSELIAAVAHLAGKDADTAAASGE